MSGRAGMRKNVQECAESCTEGQRMCGRFVAVSYDEVLGVVQAVVARMPDVDEPDWPAMRPLEPRERSDVRPGDSALVAVGGAQVAQGGGQTLAIREMTWGFEAPWESKGSSKLLYNTRLETALQRGIWAPMMQEGRCVVPVAGFYELHGTERIASECTGRLVKRPYLFEDGLGLPLLLAGVSQNGRFSVVTTEPNALVAPVHDRMPVVLSLDEAALWANPATAAQDAVELFADRRGVQMHVAPQGMLRNAGEQLSLF